MDSLRRFGCILVPAEGRKAKIPFACRAEAGAGSAYDVCTVEQAVKKVP